MVVLACSLAHPPPIWIADQVRNDGAEVMWCGVFRFLALLGMTRWWDCLAVTLTFDSSPIKGEGIDGWIGLVVVPVVPCPVDTEPNLQ